jgi:hypothetical protein
MKELLTGIWVLIWSIIVSVLIFSIGTLYSFGYSIWLTFTKDYKAFFKFWIKLIDGLLSVIGDICFYIAKSLDIGWNINGEILEDMLTAEEDTTFGEKGITVSASVGKLEVDNKLNKFGLFFTKLLNLFFWQKRHAVDSWHYYLAKKELSENFHEKKGKIKIIIKDGE